MIPPFSQIALPCVDQSKVFQPKDNPTLRSLKAGDQPGRTRNFQPLWYDRFPWISVCVTRKSVFCLFFTT